MSKENYVSDNAKKGQIFSYVTVLLTLVKVVFYKKNKNISFDHIISKNANFQ